MLSGRMVKAFMELKRRDSDLISRLTISHQQLHALIPQGFCQSQASCQATPDSRIPLTLKQLTFCFLYIFSQFPKSSRAVLQGTDAELGIVDDGYEGEAGSVVLIH